MGQRQKTLWFIRHGETDSNREQRWLGQSDPALNEVGRSQAQQLARQIARLDLSLCVYSDLRRCSETATLMLADTPNLARRSDIRLREVSWGIADGMKLKDIRHRFGQSVFNRWNSQRQADLSFCMAGGETKLQAISRVQSLIADLCHDEGIGNTALVTHSGLISLYLQKLLPAKPRPTLPHGGMIAVVCDGEKTKLLSYDQLEPFSGGQK